MFNLPIYTVKERKPVNGELILTFGVESGFDMGSIEPCWEEVEYSWIIVDAAGEDTGSQVCYEGPEDINLFVPNEPGDSMRLVLAVGGCELCDDARYAIEEDVYKLFPGVFLPKD